MTFAFWILGILAYVGAASWTFGYVRGATNDKTGWDTPAPLFSALLFPIIFAIVALKMLVVPMQKLGLSMQQKQLAEKKQRIELQQKTRIELEEAEKELDKEFAELEYAEEVVEKKRARAPRSKR